MSIAPTFTLKSNHIYTVAIVTPTRGKTRRRRVLFVFLALPACTSISDANRETTLRCLDCTEVKVTRVIVGDTLDTAKGRVRLFGVDTRSLVNGAPQRPHTGYNNWLAILFGWKMDPG